jgi:peptidoglycan/LPS O-acetylase OafA/YrhL
MKDDSGNLDYLRATAVCCVLVQHLVHTFYPQGHSALFDVRTVARLGVLLFFVHTALVLMMSLERVPGARQFYIRRAFRIYPLATICTLAMAWLFPISQMTPRVLVSNVFLVQNLTRDPSILPLTWSLPFELQMYLVLPVLSILLQRTDRPLRLIFAIITCDAVLFEVLNHFTPQYFFTSLFEFVPCFLGGVLAFSLQRQTKPSWPLWLLALPVFLVASVAWLSVPGHGGILREQSVCVLLGLLLPHFREFSNRPVRRIAGLVAKYSYGIYLTHLPSIWLASSLSASRLVKFAVLIVLLVGLPVLLYHLVEAPMIRYGKHLATWAVARVRPEPPLQPQI